jgi:hypothetical protein
MIVAFMRDGGPGGENAAQGSAALARDLMGGGKRLLNVDLRVILLLAGCAYLTHLSSAG